MIENNKVGDCLSQRIKAMTKITSRLRIYQYVNLISSIKKNVNLILIIELKKQRGLKVA